VIERVLVDYYRCPEEFVKMSLAGELSSDSGYFRFGPSVCFGQSSFGPRSSTLTTELTDVTTAVRADAGLLRVPFDPSQIVDNFRLERYVTEAQRPDSAGHTVLQTLYYSLRRFMPAALRRTLQRSYFKDFKSLPFPQWPVDDSVDRILQRLCALALKSQDVTRLPFIWFWPNGAPSCAVVTHDVETTVGRDRCAWLMDVDESYGIKSSFQIVPEERYTLSSAFLDSVRTRGFEVNLHDLNHDGRLFSDRDDFRRRAQRINEHARQLGARGFRSGQLYRQPSWYDALQVSYDMSIPNAAHLEVQRGGCCTVMPYFIGDIVELPLTTTQDYSLFHVLRDFSDELWADQIAQLRARNGLMTFIAHPDYLEGNRAVETYRALLTRLARLRDAGECWVALPGAVERWWRQRSRLSLVRDGARWRIEGDGADRARIAFAEVRGDDLVYRVGPGSSE